MSQDGFCLPFGGGAMINTDIQVWDRDAPEQSLQEAHGLDGCLGF